MTGKSGGTLIELALDACERERMCSLGNRFSLLVEFLEFVEAVEEARKRDRCFELGEVSLLDSGAISLAKDGGLISS